MQVMAIAAWQKWFGTTDRHWRTAMALFQAIPPPIRWLLLVVGLIILADQVIANFPEVRMLWR
jgi:hypothetical protein